MNDHTELEARVAALETALAFERAERSALERITIPPLTEAREGLSLLERNFELSMKHLSERVAEAVRSGDGDINSAVIEAVHTLLTGMVNMCLDASSKQTLISIKMLHRAMLDDDKVLADRVTALERRFRLLELFLGAKFVAEAA